jgi:hypothetical protein
LYIDSPRVVSLGRDRFNGDKQPGAGSNFSLFTKTLDVYPDFPGFWSVFIRITIKSDMLRA